MTPRQNMTCTIVTLGLSFLCLLLFTAKALQEELPDFNIFQTLALQCG